MKKVIALLLLMLAGCATATDRLVPVPPLTGYDNHDCAQLAPICADTAERVILYSKLQESKRRDNKFKMAMNILVLPIFWWGLGDDENTAQLQSYMGQYQECVNSADRLQCDFERKSLTELQQ